MNELQWLGASAPAAMLNQVIEAASPRKLRLFACACCRLVWDRLKDDRPRRAIEVGERFADQRATDAEREEAQRAAFQYSDERGRSPESVAPWWTVVPRDRPLLKGAAAVCSHNTRRVKGRNLNRAQADLLRDLFGNPFRAAPLLAPEVLAWDGGQVVKLARAIYDERRFGDLAVLADALQEAGCEDRAILSHCRAPGRHALGCWVVDLVLGKG